MTRALEPAHASSAPSTIQSLGPRNRALARWVANGNVDPKSLSERFGITATRVLQVLRSPLFQAEVKRLQDRLEESAIDAKAELDALLPRAVEIVAEDLFEQEKSSKRTKVAFDVLDRTGNAPRQSEPGQKQGIQVNIFAPLPGEDPVAAEARLKPLREEALRNTQEEEE